MKSKTKKLKHTQDHFISWRKLLLRDPSIKGAVNDFVWGSLV
jgi:hypothetical protein